MFTGCHLILSPQKPGWRGGRLGLPPGLRVPAASELHDTSHPGHLPYGQAVHGAKDQGQSQGQVVIRVKVNQGNQGESKRSDVEGQWQEQT